MMHDRICMIDDDVSLVSLPDCFLFFQPADVDALHKKLIQLLHLSKSSALKTKCLSVMQLLNSSKNDAAVGSLWLILDHH